MERENCEFAIDISDVWKVFGANAAEVLGQIEANALSKKDALEKHNCVIGVSDVSMKIRQGEIFCVMGLSGSGKSTLVRHINRLLEPTKGKIIVNGQDVMAMDAAELRKFRNEKIAMVFQNFALMPHRSVLDNVSMPLEIRAMAKNERLRIAESVLERVELKGWGHKFAHELSGGMQQRVGLARALAADPEILLMDEPFSALDPLIRRQLQNEFMALAASMNKTTVFITHDLDEAVRIGDRIAIMRDGKIVQIGTPEEIVTNPEDDYVSDFVAGISRLKVVRARAVMRPIREFEAEHGTLAASQKVFAQDENLGNLIEHALNDERPLAIVNDAGETVGAITRADLLRTIMEGAEVS